MTIEDQIQALLAKAEPLRALVEDDEAKRPLAGIVDKINALRAQQEQAKRAEFMASLGMPTQAGGSAAPIGETHEGQRQEEGRRQGLLNTGGAAAAEVVAPIPKRRGRPPRGEHE